jgi:hypothetical protein
MKRPLLLCAVAVVCLLAAAGSALAQEPIHLATTLFGREEVPALSNFGRGTFEGELSADLTELTWTLEFGPQGSPVTQAHIHIGQRGVNGGIMVFFCSNLGNGPAGTPACPEFGGTLSGSFTAANIIGPTGQGVAAGQFFEFQRALRQGVAYANVHTVNFPGGEIRGQVRVVD